MSSLYVSRNGLEGSNSMKSHTTPPVVDKAKEWQMELLMEKLRSKAGQFKTFGESAKLLRMALLEKRYPVDGVERIQLQKCLDTLQNSIRVTTLSGMVERLESISRQLGLKFMTTGGAGLEWFISSDMFYVEVVLEPSGNVKDVKIHHEGKTERQSCEELVSCLQQQDFADFATQLEGLASIYQLNAEKPVKTNALNALQSLEADLTTLYNLQTMDAQSMLCKSPVGILQKRRGGHAMRLTYWVSPYDLLDKKTMSEVTMTVEQVNKRKLGYSVTVCMEASTAHKLQISPLVTSQRGSNGNNVPSYTSLQAMNSATLPACFALKLHEPLPLCISLARRIHLITDMECGDLSTPHPLLSLITQHTSRGQLDCANNNGLFVNLPDQTHCYRMTETKGLEAVMVSSIPFTHPKQVPHILGLLRQQAIFNSLISSCIRGSGRHDLDVILLEVTALTWQHLSISLEHPHEESMTTVEIDLTDPANFQCNLFGAGTSSNQTVVTPEFAAKIFQRCMSIPVTMRSLIKKWENQASASNGHSNGNGNFNLPLGNGGSGGGGGGGGGGHHDDSSRHGMSDYNMRDPHIKMEPHDGSNDMGDSASNFPSFNSPFSGDLSNASPLSAFAASSSMMGQSKEPVVINLMSDGLPKKKARKRKVMDNLWPKHKGDECEILVESSSNDSTPHGTPTSRDAPADFRIPTPNSFELSHLMEDGKPDPASTDKGQSELEGMSVEDVMEIQEMDSVEEMLKAVSARKIKKPREERKSPPSIMLDIDGKSMVPPSVSITPINTSSSSSLSSSLNSVLSGMGLERRPGIEIIPIGSTPPATLPSTITITPIPPSKGMSDDRSRDRKSRDKARSEEEEKRLEKKRKRRREDSPMGPPDKLPPKPDPLSKPVSVSIKPTDSPPMSMSRPSSPAGTLRKFSTSPTHTSPLVLMSKSASSPGGMSKSAKPSPTHQSPKHSPAYSTSSPKHNPMTSSVSPKHHGTSSPKHTSGSSGKPSMSTLKSAANSPSSVKSGSSDPMKVKPPSSSKDGSSNRDKDRSRMPTSLPGLVSSSSSSSGGGSSSTTSSSGGGGGSGCSSSVSSSGHQSPKLKSSSMKVKQPDFSIGSDTTVTPIPPPPPPAVSGSSTSPSSSQDCKQSSSSQLPQIRNRKNSLSAVIDKLKSQHTTGDDIAVTVSNSSLSASASGSCGMVSNDPSSGNGNGNRERIPTPTKGTEMKVTSVPGKPGDSGKNPGEYMVKPGSEGIKLTINKTRAKETSSKSAPSSSSSSSGMIKSCSQSGSGSPKLGHTGLKPGVNSGPASKKPQSSSSSSISSSSSPGLPKIPSSSGVSSGSSSSSTGVKSSSNPSSSKNPSSSSVTLSSSSSSTSAFPKSSSSSGSSKSISKSSGSPKLGSSSSSSDPNRNRDGSKPRPPKSSSSSSGGGGVGGSSSSSSSSGASGSGSDKSLFGGKEARKSSPAPPRDEESERTFKAITSKIDATFGLEGFVKQLDTKFQIPKLSARSSNPDSDQTKKTTPEKSDSGSSNRSMETTRALDLVKPEPKYSTSSPIPSTSPSLPPSSSGITVTPITKSDEKLSSGQIESKMAKTSSASITPTHSSPSPRLTPSPLPKLESKTPTDGSPIPGLTITPIGSISSLGCGGTGGGSSSNDSMDLSIDLSRPSSETKGKSESQRGNLGLSITPSSSSKDDFSMRSGSPSDSSVLKADKPRDFSMVGEECKKIALETAFARMEESRATTPSSQSSQDATELLLDFSSTSKAPSEPSVRKMTVTERVMAVLPSRRNTTPPPPMFPASPSVTMHIVKSPSSLIIPSPQSGSPCIIDDDLMDEALTGMGK